MATAVAVSPQFLRHERKTHYPARPGKASHTTYTLQTDVRFTPLIHYRDQI
jgi:hypothetical protein